MIGVTRAAILKSSFSALKVSVTTSYVLVVLSVVPKVFMSSTSVLIGFSCSFFFNCCVMNVLCDPVSTRIRA